ncbi:MAG: DsrE family protein [Deltaproteobacteria bacterium]|nr:DsrE family protein [Deltaproteobacteria bacterium]
MKQVGIVLSTPPEVGDFPRVMRLALAARERGIEVGIFLMSAAVTWVSDAYVARLLDEGCDVVACGTSLARLGISDVSTGVVVGSQDDHAALVDRADRIVAFT